MNTVRYPALRTTQLTNGEPIVLFSAPATEIESWAGIPQKKKSSQDAETTGFQRDENAKRINDLVSFMKDPRNVIQNPLLCATQSDICGSVRFISDPTSPESRTQTGHLEITYHDYASMPLLDCMKSVRRLLETRVPELSSLNILPDLLTSLKQKLRTSDDDAGGDTPSQATAPDDTSSSDDTRTDADDDQSDTAVIFSDESHVLDFWHELSARIQIVEELGGSFKDNELLGFSRDAMISFLKPVVVMDGQHRLRGAIKTAYALSNDSEECRTAIETAINSGEDPQTAQENARNSSCRSLPISLLLSTDPAEHVFQFVVVNQKATPIGKALLGTIVSTTLSNEEMNRVSTRLTSAGIQLEQSRAVAFLSRNPESPFHGLVETGLAGESGDRLAWSVLASLARIFQHLDGGQLFGQKIDYADKWRRDLLNESPIVSSYEEKGFETPFSYWSSGDGPWRDVFIGFFQFIKEHFSTDDPETYAYWGTPRSSNLFNKISLWILAADFFQFLVDRKLTLDGPADVRGLAEDWLDGVSTNYFNRDWRMAKTKKDAPAIREQWAKLWVDYRKDPQRLPASTEYRKNG